MPNLFATSAQSALCTVIGPTRVSQPALLFVIVYHQVGGKKKEFLMFPR